MELWGWPWSLVKTEYEGDQKNLSDICCYCFSFSNEVPDLSFDCPGIHWREASPSKANIHTEGTGLDKASVPFLTEASLFYRTRFILIIWPFGLFVLCLFVCLFLSSCTLNACSYVLYSPTESKPSKPYPCPNRSRNPGPCTPSLSTGDLTVWPWVCRVISRSCK